MAKKKQDFFEKLIEKNAEQKQQENKNNKVPVAKNKKRKSTKIIITSVLLIGAIATGITVPLVVNSTKKIYKDKMKDDTNVYKFLKDEDTKGSSNVGAHEDNYKDEKKIDSEKRLEALNKIALFYLYEKEQKASEEYQDLWNQNRESGEDEDKTLRLSTIDELRKKFKNELLDIQNNTKLQFGTENWETEFNKKLIEEYNGAQSIDEAVEFKIENAIVSDALRRFRLRSGEKTKEIEKKNKDGEYVYKWWHEGSDKFYEIQGEKLALSTDSFIYEDKYKLITPFLEKFIKDENPYMFSEFILPGIAPEKADDKWDVKKENFLKYLFIAKDGTFNLQGEDVGGVYKPEIKQAYELVKSNFKPFNEYAKLLVEADPKNGVYAMDKKAANYSAVLNHFSNSSSTIKSNWGTGGIMSVTSLLSKENFHTFLAILPELLISDKHSKTDLIREIDYFGAIEKIRVELAKKAGIEKYELADLNTNELAAEYNKKMEEFFTDVDEEKDKGLTEKVFKSLVLDELSKVFIKDDKISTVYKIKGFEDVYGILTKEGFKIFYCQTDFKKEDLIKMIQNDFIIEKNFKGQTAVKYKVMERMSKGLGRNEYLSILLKEEEFINHLKEKDNKFILDADGNLVEGAKYDDEAIQQLGADISRSLAFNKYKKFIVFSKDATTWMKERAKNNFDEFFELRDDQPFFKYNDLDKDGNTTSATSLTTKHMLKKYDEETYKIIYKE